MTFFIANKRKFETLMEVEKLSMTTGQRKKMKERILDDIAANVDARWDRIKKIKRVIDEIVYKLTDRGFSFNGRETLADKCQVSLSTIDKATRLLKDSGLFFVAYKENLTGNGVKTPIFFYRKHMLFATHASILGIEEPKKSDDDHDNHDGNKPDYKEETDTNNEVEGAETPCGSKAEPQSRKATYLEPNSFKDLNKKRTQDVLDKSFVSESVPEEFKNLVAIFFESYKDIEEFWRVVRQNNYRTNYAEDVIVPLAVNAFKQVVRKIKTSKLRNPFGYFHGIISNKLDELRMQEEYEILKELGRELADIDLPY